ncbi:MLP family protein [Clostridium perfringens]|nr:MLP family protein [Clostridium perfringens]
MQKDIDLKSSATGFYQLFRKESHKVPTATSRNIQAVALHEGDWHTHGAIKIWNYTMDGKPEVFKEKVGFDDANMTITVHGLEGDLFKHYKVYWAALKIVPKNKGSVAKISLEYERVNEDAPIPNKYMDFLVSMTEDIDAHLSTASK